MNASYDSYRIFYYAAKYGGFTQAANALGGNQSNITRTVKGLEAALGCKLFFRSNRGVQLTPEGEKLYAHVSLAVGHIRAGEEEIASRQSLQSGMVAVAGSEIALHCCLLPALKAYRASYPGVRIRVSNHSAPQAIEAVKGGLADFAVVTLAQRQPKALHCRRIMEIQELPIAGAAFGFLQGKALALEELARLPLVGLGPQTAAFDFYSRLFAAQGLPYRPDIEAATADQILPLVTVGLGVGFVPDFFARDGIQAGSVFALMLDAPIPTRPVCILKQESQPLSAAARELERMVMAAQAETRAGNARLG